MDFEFEKGDKVVATFSLYDYYKDRWHYGGLTEDIKYGEDFVKVLDEMLNSLK